LSVQTWLVVNGSYKKEPPSQATTKNVVEVMPGIALSLPPVSEIEATDAENNLTGKGNHELEDARTPSLGSP